MGALRAVARVVLQFVYSLGTWYGHRTAGQRYRAQAHVVAAWVVREVRRVLHGPVSTDLAWQLDQFQLFLAFAIYRELVKNRGYYPITNSPLLSPVALFDQALREARIYPPEPVIQALPSVRIRIVPGWVKVYSLGLPQSAPTILYPEEYTRR